MRNSSKTETNLNKSPYRTNILTVTQISLVLKPVSNRKRAETFSAVPRKSVLDLFHIFSLHLHEERIIQFATLQSKYCYYC